MILTYYKAANFGDAINPLVFEHFLPNFFDDDPELLFYGIGSILGFERPFEKTRKVIVFSSGFAYDQPPVLDQRYDVRCVRGPLTARRLNIDASKGVADGALLLQYLPVFSDKQEKKYKFSYIPHHVSEKMFDGWNEILEPLGIHYISPAGDPVQVVNEIRQSECILAEAMHAAIIADTFRVPWIPVKMFLHINSFKWLDWMLSLQISEAYNPYTLRRVYNKEWIKKIIKNKTLLGENTLMNDAFSSVYQKIQKSIVQEKLQQQLGQIMKLDPFLSKQEVLLDKQLRLLEIIEGIKRDYS